MTSQSGFDDGGDYSVRVSARARHLQLKVDFSGQVEVIVPQGMSMHHVPGFVSRNRVWIEKQKSHFHGQEDQASDLPGRIDLSAVGESWEVEYSISPARRIAMSGNRASQKLIVRSDNDEATRRLLLNWLSARGRFHLVPWLQRTADETGLSFSSVSIRGQKTRWGSCSSKGHISLNRSLLFLPDHLVEYVLVHELCHTRHLNHSDAFWQYVSIHSPQYRRHEKNLNHWARKLPLWIYQ